MVKPPACIVVLLLVSAAAKAQDPRATRESQTVRTPELGAIIEEIAKDADAALEKPTDRLLVTWLIDNSSLLKSTRHHELFSEHIARAFASQKPGVHHAVVAFAEQPQLILKATPDPRTAGRAIEWLATQKPDDTIKNCCENVRVAASYAASFSGKRLLVLYTPQNGDNEDNVEATLKVLRDTGTALHAIVDEAIYSDPYWESLTTSTSTGYYGDSQPYRRLKFQLAGPDSSVIEFPYGWPLTHGDPTYTVPSGYAPWAINRLATYSNGRTYLYGAGDSTQSFCQRWGCGVCDGQHKLCGATYDVTKLRLTAPLIESRDAIREALSQEQLSLALYEAWQKLHRLGLLHRSGSLKMSSGRLVPARPTTSSTYPLSFGSDWRVGMGTCKRLLGELDKVIAEFDAHLSTIDEATSKRALATAEAFSVHLRLLRVNLSQLRAFCEDLLEHERKKHLPEEGFGGDGLEDLCGHKMGNWSYRNAYLCHGGAALKGLHLAGGEAERAELVATLDLADRVIERHRGTPWEVLVRRGALAIYVPAGD